MLQIVIALLLIQALQALRALWSYRVVQVIRVLRAVRVFRIFTVRMGQQSWRRKRLTRTSTIVKTFIVSFYVIVHGQVDGRWRLPHVEKILMKKKVWLKVIIFAGAGIGVVEKPKLRVMRGLYKELTVCSMYLFFTSHCCMCDHA